MCPRCGHWSQRRLQKRRRPTLLPPLNTSTQTESGRVSRTMSQLTKLNKFAYTKKQKKITEFMWPWSVFNKNVSQHEGPGDFAFYNFKLYLFYPFKRIIFSSTLCLSKHKCQLYFLLLISSLGNIALRGLLLKCLLMQGGKADSIFAQTASPSFNINRNFPYFNPWI